MGLIEALRDALGMDTVIVFLLALAAFLVLKLLMLKASESKPGWVLLIIIPAAGILCLMNEWYEWGILILALFILTAIYIRVEKRRQSERGSSG